VNKLYKLNSVKFLIVTPLRGLCPPVIARPEWSEERSNLSVESLYTSLRGR